jgi:ABC-2 type transport system permease protein
VIGILLMLTAHFAGHVTLSFGECAQLLACNVLGVLPFCALGLFIGSLVSGSAAPAITNFIYLPMAFVGGLWIPIWLLPQVLQTLAPLWPAYHLGQLAEMAVDSRNDGAALTHIAVLAGVTLLFFRLASRRLAKG